MKTSAKLTIRAIRGPIRNQQAGTAGDARRSRSGANCSRASTPSKPNSAPRSKTEGEGRRHRAPRRRRTERRGTRAARPRKQGRAARRRLRSPTGARADRRRGGVSEGDGVLRLARCRGRWLLRGCVNPIDVEHRVDAATPAPGTSNVNQRDPLGRVFARRSATMALGVPMPAVPTGDVVSSGPDRRQRCVDSREGCQRRRRERRHHHRDHACRRSASRRSTSSAERIAPACSGSRNFCEPTCLRSAPTCSTSRCSPATATGRTSAASWR